MCHDTAPNLGDGRMDDGKKVSNIKQVEEFFKTFMSKLEEGYDRDPEKYDKAIGSLLKNKPKIAKANDATIQKALHSWQKNDIFAIKKGKKAIPVQNTVRRQNTKRGKRASRPGPTKGRRNDGNNESDDDTPNKEMKKRKRSLADLVSGNIPPRKKH